MNQPEDVVVVEKVVPGGFGLARLGRRIVLVRGAIPGERVRLKRDRPGKGGVAFARVAEVLEASPDRVVPEGDVACGGLALAHVRYERQLELKREMLLDALRRTGRFVDVPPIDVVGSPGDGWRMRARLHVDRERLGFFREGTHDLCVPPASQLPEAMREAAAETLAWTPQALRHTVSQITIADDLAGTRRAAHLTLRHPAAANVWPDTAPSGVAGVSIGSVTGGAPTDVAGVPALCTPLAEVMGRPEVEAQLQWHPAAFFQANRTVVPLLVAGVVAAAGDRPMTDLFAGVGLFGVAAASSGARDVVCVEGDEVASRWLQRNARDVSERTGARVQAVQVSVENFVASPSADLAGRAIVVDPPRTGLPPGVCGRLGAVTGCRLIYVSCDPPTLSRDLRRLVDAGYAIRSIQAFDMFPQTAHVETLVVLDREA